MKNYFGLTPYRRHGFESEFDKAFDDFFAPMEFNFNPSKEMKADIREKDGQYLIDINLPGYKKEEVAINLIDGNLVIEAKHEFSKEEKDEKGNMIRSERRFGSCSRSFYVGDSVEAEDVKAKLEDGVLKISVPKKEDKKLENKKLIAIE